MESALAFGLQGGRDPSESKFVSVLHSRAVTGGWYADADARPADDRLTLTVEVIDSDAKAVLRVLRVDYTGEQVVVGEDETYQLATELDPTRASVHSKTSGSVAELAEFAADWLEKELERPIDRVEWQGWTFWHRRWIFVDTGEVIVWSDSRNRRNRRLGRPKRRVRVHRRE
jgi:hypothetical protein